jgi:hypothetical protein
MKTLLTVALALAALAGQASAHEDFTPAEIAQLPSDKVQAIKKYCEKEWNENFRMRVFCEDQQYKALKVLINRGSEKD